jgi:hypothetical protein
MRHLPNHWLAAVLHAVCVCLLVLGLFYDWFVVANRSVIFLYGHMGAAPFDEFTSGRYWMSGLVASGIVLVVYTSANWLLGRIVGLRYGIYCPPKWWQTWCLCVVPLGLGILTITMTFNWPTLPWANALACVAATLLSLPLALAPSSLAAQHPAELGWRVLFGLGLLPSLLLLRAIELPGKGFASAPAAYGMAFGGLLAGALWLAGLTWLRAKRRRPPIGPGRLLASGLCLSYVLLPLIHHLVFTPPDYRYISASSNFFAFDPGIQLLSFGVTVLLAVGVAKGLRRPPTLLNQEDKSE